MTSAPVVSVTDELLAEIESQAQSKHSDGFKLVHNIECLTVLALATELRRLRAENEALRVDAGRFEWWFNKTRERTPDAVDVTLDQWRASLDTAMQSNTEGSK